MNSPEAVKLADDPEMAANLERLHTAAALLASALQVVATEQAVTKSDIEDIFAWVDEVKDEARKLDKRAGEAGLMEL